VCEKYSELIYVTLKNPILLVDNEDSYIKFKDCHDVLPLIVNGTLANPKEFPHMVGNFVIIIKSIISSFISIY